MPEHKSKVRGVWVCPMCGSLDVTAGFQAEEQRLWNYRTQSWHSPSAARGLKAADLDWDEAGTDHDWCARCEDDVTLDYREADMRDEVIAERLLQGLPEKPPGEDTDV